jgi:hypothetical protein
MFRHVLEDLHLLDSSSPTPVYNDNRGAVDWSNTSSTKGMRHVNIRENAVREPRLLNEISVLHVPGECNPANHLLLFYPSSLSSSVPCLDGGC